MTDDIDIYGRHQALCERSNELRAWAMNRIAWCRAMTIMGTSDMYTAAQVEQRALETVLRILNGKEMP